MDYTKTSNTPAIIVLYISLILTVGFKALQYSHTANDTDWKAVAGAALWLFLLVWIVFANKQRVAIVLFAMSTILTTLAVIVMAHKNWQIQNFIEHALQYGVPALAGLYVLKSASSKTVQRIAKVLMAATFVGHGVYAFGVDIASTNFVPMVSATLNVDVQTAQNFLRVAAVLDFLFAASILTGIGLRYTIWYGVVWGVLTALARWYYFGMLGMENGTMLKAMVETGFRMCHGLIPLWYWQVYLRSTGAKVLILKSNSQ